MDTNGLASPRLTQNNPIPDENPELNHYESSAFFVKSDDAKKALEKYYKATTKELGKGAFGEVLMYESVDESVTE